MNYIPSLSAAFLVREVWLCTYISCPSSCIYEHVLRCLFCRVDGEDDETGRVAIPRNEDDDPAVEAAVLARASSASLQYVSQGNLCFRIYIKE